MPYIAGVDDVKHSVLIAAWDGLLQELLVQPLAYIPTRLPPPPALPFFGTSADLIAKPADVASMLAQTIRPGHMS